MKLNELSIKELYGVAYTELMEGDSTVAIKELIKEFKKRKLPMPLPIKMQPKMMLIDIIDVPKRHASGIVAPDGSKTKSEMSLYHNHPNQGRVVALSDKIEWEDLTLGCKVALNSPGGALPVYKYQDEVYAFVGYSIIIGVI